MDYALKFKHCYIYIKLLDLLTWCMFIKFLYMDLVVIFVYRHCES